MTSVSAGHIILTPIQPVGSGRPQRGSNPGPPHQSRALPTELLRPPRERETKRKRWGENKDLLVDIHPLYKLSTPFVYSVKTGQRDTDVDFIRMSFNTVIKIEKGTELISLVCFRNLEHLKFHFSHLFAPSKFGLINSKFCCAPPTRNSYSYYR